MPIDQAMITFLGLVKKQSYEKNPTGLGVHSRAELISLFHANFESKEKFSEVLDQLFYNKLMDAESKENHQFEGYFVTDLGVEFLLQPDKFRFVNGTLEIRSDVVPIDSSRWTGTRFVLVDAKAIAEVRDAADRLHGAVHSISFASNSDSQNLKGLADALVAVCSMAEPEVTIIDRILASPKFKECAALLVFVATIRGALGI